MYSRWNGEDENIEQEIQQLEEHEAQYQIFQDDSRVVVDEGDLEPIERLLQHKYDKYKYVSQEFLKRNHLKKSSKSAMKSSKKANIVVEKPVSRSLKQRARVSVRFQSSPSSRTDKTPREIATSTAKSTKRSTRASDILEKLADVKISRSEVREGRISPERAESILKRISESSQGKATETKKKSSDRNK